MPQDNDPKRQPLPRERVESDKRPRADSGIGRGGDLILEDDAALEGREAEREDAERTLAKREAEQDLEDRD